MIIALVNDLCKPEKLVLQSERNLKIRCVMD